MQTAAPDETATGFIVKQTTAAPTGPSGIISLVAGTGFIGDSGNGGLAVEAQLIEPEGIAVDKAGNVYIADQYAQVVRKITASTGVISIFAGTGNGGYSGDGGPALKAELNEPQGLALDAAGDLYIADSRNNVIRKVTAATGDIATVAGNGAKSGPGSDNLCEGVGLFGLASVLPATTVSLCVPTGVALDSADDLYIADEEDSAIREVNAKTGEIATVAGNGSPGYSGDGGKAVDAKLRYPTQVALDSSNNIYIADTDNCAIRKVNAKTGDISSLVGTPNADGFGGACGLAGDGAAASKAEVNYPGGVAVDEKGNVFIGDSFDDIVRLISASNGKIYTVAGNYTSYGTTFYGNYGFSGYGGIGTLAELDTPGQLAADSEGDLYGVDPGNYVAFEVTTASALPGAAPAISPDAQTYTGALKVTIKPPVTGALVYYTLNGTVPTTNSTKYTGPFTITNESAVVTAFATVTGEVNSVAGESVYLSPPAAPHHLSRRREDHRGNHHRNNGRGYPCEERPRCPGETGSGRRLCHRSLLHE